MQLILDGKSYTVSQQWGKVISAALGTLSFDGGTVDSHINALLHASNARALKDGELQTLAALTHVKNVANTIRVVGAHHDPVKEWGLDGWDAVHGNSNTLPCGCVRQFVFDHHSASNHFGHNRVSAERKHYYIEPRRLCEMHK